MTDADVKTLKHEIIEQAKIWHAANQDVGFVHHLEAAARYACKPPEQFRWETFVARDGVWMLDLEYIPAGEQTLIDPPSPQGLV
jgi:hypothetical protein